MKQLKSLYRDTWFLWLTALAASVALVATTSYFFLVNFPILLVVFVYMAYVRYDLDGNVREN